MPHPERAGEALIGGDDGRHLFAAPDPGAGPGGARARQGRSECRIIARVGVPVDPSPVVKPVGPSPAPSPPPGAGWGIALAAVGALLAALAMLGYILSIVIPHQVATSAAQGVPRGNLSDLYPRWLGTRELLQHGRNPYSAAVTRDIQLGYYGVALTPDSPIKDQQGFAYPLYVVFLLAPLTLFPFSMVQPLFGWALLLLTALSVPLWLRALGWTLPRPALLAAALLAAGSWPALQGWALEQLTLLVAALLAAAAACLAVGDGGWGLGVGTGVGGGGGGVGRTGANEPISQSKIQNPKSKITNPPAPSPHSPRRRGGVAGRRHDQAAGDGAAGGRAGGVGVGPLAGAAGVAWGFLVTLGVLAGGAFLLLPGWPRRLP